jgi:hypothetical protein
MTRVWWSRLLTLRWPGSSLRSTNAPSAFSLVEPIAAIAQTLQNDRWLDRPVSASYLSVLSFRVFILG